MKLLTLFFILLSITALFAQLPVGTTRTTVTTDASGNILNTPLILSNQVTMTVAATTANQLVRFNELTNSIAGSTNVVIPVRLGGTGVATTQLAGSWTNTINFRVNGTNDSNAYRIQGQLGFTGVVTNNGNGSTNFTAYLLGIVTNNVRTP